VPAGASWKQFVHYGQGYINAGKITIVQREGKDKYAECCIVYYNELRKTSKCFRTL